MEKLIIELEKLRFKMLEVLIKALMAILVIGTLLMFDVDLTKTTSGYIIGALVIDATSNRLAFCQRISATKIRVYSPVADTTVTVRILLSN